MPSLPSSIRPDRRWSIPPTSAATILTRPRAPIAVDTAGNAYVTGNTISTDFPTTSGAFQTVKGASQDAFITKLDPTGSTLVYSTYLGGGLEDMGFGIALDALGDAYVTGPLLPVTSTTAGAFQRRHMRGRTILVTTFL